MSREVNNELKTQIYDYLKSQWLLFNKGLFSCSFSQISNYIEKTYGEHVDYSLVSYYINKLIDEKEIRVIPGSGRRSNMYAIVENKDDEKEIWRENKQWKNEEENEDNKNEGNEKNIIIKRDKIDTTINNLTNQLNVIQNELEELIITKNKFHHLVESLKELDYFAETQDGYQLFKLPKNYFLKEVLDSVQQNRGVDLH